MHLHDLTIKQYHDKLVSKEFSAQEAVEEFLSHAETIDREIGAFLDFHKESARETAVRVDELLASKNEIPVLAGVPLGIKDAILVEGKPTTAASKILEKYIASYDATVIKKLKDSHAVIVGKTNLDEFAMGTSTENSAFKITRNPYDLERVPGGSSGGSAAAVCAGSVLGALGSDTGGSIRQPAAFCGIVGLKPTYGAVSRHGLIALASSLDQIGPFGKTVEDVITIFDCIKGADEYDATSVRGEYETPTEVMSIHQVRNLKVGVPKEYFIEGIAPVVKTGVESAIEKVKRMGLEVKEISLPHTKYALSTYYIVLPAEASTNLARFDGIRYARRDEVEGKTLKRIYPDQKTKGFGDEPTRRILLGTFVLSAGYYDAYYAKAQKVRTLIKEDFDKAFEEVDLIVAPVTPSQPFKIGEKVNDPLSLYLEDVFTLPINLAGLPSLAVPIKKYSLAEKELPIGFQIIGRRYHEHQILSLGTYYEKC